MSSNYPEHRQQSVRSGPQASKSCNDNFHCLKDSEAGISGISGRMISGASMNGVSAENVRRSDNVGNVVHRSDSLRSFAVPMSSLSSSSSDATSTSNQYSHQKKSLSHHQHISSSRSFEANKMSANAHNGAFSSICDSKPAKYICSKVIEPKIILYSANTAPKFLLHNCFIWTGYRAFLPYRLCLKSVFIWSNETINIWTHLLGWMFFFTLMLYDNLVVLPQFKKHVTIMEFVIGNVSLLCFQICMAMSVGFHVFGCHSEKMCQHWLGWDLTGISAAILGCYLPGIYYAFYCFPIWRDIYLAIVLLILVITLVLPIFLRDYLSLRCAPLRITLYITTMLYGFIPAIHWVILSGGLSSDWVQVFFPKLVVTYLIAGLAFAFYISDFPERCFPGRFDYFGHAHQWWHVLVVAALYYWHDAGLSFMKRRLVESCFNDVDNGTYSSLNNTSAFDQRPFFDTD